MPWLIVAWPTQQIFEFEPTGYKAPMIGREFFHGVVDCYSLIRDYYKEELQIEIPDFNRPDDWWLKEGGNLYLENFELAGFERVFTEQPELHDVILMQVASKVPNHGAIYLGNNIILHHVHGRLSCREVYGGYWAKHTYCIVRHMELTA